MELDQRWDEISEAIANEEQEEAKLDGIDGHEEDFAGAESAAADTDELVDGQEGDGDFGGAGDGGGEESGSVYIESEGDGAGGGEVPLIEEVEGMETAGLDFVGHVAERVFGRDDRKRVGNTRPFPWRTICDLEITAADGSRWQCTGSMIGPRTVLTNGHCVFNHKRGGWARRIRVIPGRDGSREPFGSAVGTRFHSVKGWTKRKSFNYDYGAVILPPDQKLGKRVGWMGISRLSLPSLMGLRVNSSGYPGDKGGSTQWWNANNILAVTPRRVYYRIDTNGGQSGSPVWRYRGGKRHIVAVHNTGGLLFNGAVRVNRPVFKNLVNWKKNYT